MDLGSYLSWTVLARLLNAIGQGTVRSHKTLTDLGATDDLSLRCWFPSANPGRSSDNSYAALSTCHASSETGKLVTLVALVYALMRRTLAKWLLTL